MNVVPPSFAVGSMVRARGREWVVLPSDDSEELRLRPLGGTDDDACGLFLPLEGSDVTPATLPLPDPQYAGNAVAAGLLRDAIRLSLRSGGGPFRSLARIAVEPRPYQLVPLLMALRQDPVRLLIGDDVGIGKTVEAALIARELWDRGEIRRICVLCPPHLCDQWRQELTQKFHLPAEVVRPGTVTALGRDLPLDRSIFQEYPVTVVSIDFIKSDRRRAQFVQTCPEFVIVDEAHGAAQSASAATGQQQRHNLLRELVKADPSRHLVLVTATPHSGDEQAFASLVGLLVPELQEPVAQLQYGAGTRTREVLARHFVQRQRRDLQGYLDARTPFPVREKLEPEPTYCLTPDYRRLLEATRAYAHELVRRGQGMSKFHQRVRWWAALALLRCVSSSPAAAAVTLRTRAAGVDAADAESVDRLGQDTVFDLQSRDESEQDDTTPGAAIAEESDTGSAEHRRLLELARLAESIRDKEDPKLGLAEKVVRDLLAEGFRPIVFCRYVATAHYVREALGRRLKGVTIAAVTGELPPEERAERVVRLAEADRPVLVATDCLAEGINLQRHFDAVVHYDLAWNPTRHEQREGRVDRYGQRQPKVRTALIYGQDNPVDGAVLRVLLRRAERIRNATGVSVPVPVDSNAVLEAILEALVLRPSVPPEQLSFNFENEEQLLDRVWQDAADREQRTRTIFAQHGLKPEEVLPELKAAAEAIGTESDVERFVFETCSRLGAPLERRNGHYRLDPIRLPLAVREVAGLGEKPVQLAFSITASTEAEFVPRTHPLVEALASYTLDTAIGNPMLAVAARCGAVRTDEVQERAVLALLRARYIVEEQHRDGVHSSLVEECFPTALQGDLRSPEWLDQTKAEALSQLAPAANLTAGQAHYWVNQARDAWPAWLPQVRKLADLRAQELLEAHRRVRSAARLTGVRYQVQSHPEVDLLGLYVLLPVPSQ